MIPAQWLPSLPPPANGWLPVYYELSEDSALRQGEYRVDGDLIWARNDRGSITSVRRDPHRADVVVARLVLHLLDHGL